MKKLLLIFTFSLFIFHSNAQQYWHRVKGGIGNIGGGMSVGSLYSDSINNLLYAGGYFNIIDGSIGCSSTAIWNGSDWTTNTNFNSNPLATTVIFFQGNVFIGTSNQSNAGSLLKNTGGNNWVTAGNMNDVVTSLCVYHNKLYVGGDFTQVNGMPASFIASYDGTNWSALGSGIWCTQFPGHVRTLCVWNDKLIAGGSFDQAGGLTVHSVAAWNDTTWSDVGGGVTYTSPTNVASVYALCVHDSDLIVGGTISHADGLPVNNICRFNGSNWFALGAGVDANVYSLLSFKGKLNVGGEFEIAGGISASRFAYWNDTTWATTYGGGVFNSVFAMAVYDSVLYIGGLFGYIGNVNCNHIAALYDYPDSSLAIYEIENREENISIYPNPAHQQLTVSELKQGDKIQVSDMTGRVLIQTTESTIDVSYLSSGIYLLEIKTQDGKRAVKKFVKE